MNRKEAPVHSPLDVDNDALCAATRPNAQVPPGARQIDLHLLELRYAATRIDDAAAVRRLAESIGERGQLVPCIAACAPDGGALVLIDGYRRVSALVRVGADTALVQCWLCPVGAALAQLLAQSRSRAFDPIEEALLLRELIDAHGLSQREAARQCARDVSWVQRRLVLLDALPDELVRAVPKCQAGWLRAFWHRWRAPTVCMHWACCAASMPTRSPRASCRAGSSTTRAPGNNNASVWWRTRACSSRAYVNAPVSMRPKVCATAPNAKRRSSCAGCTNCCCACCANWRHVKAH